jgi:hypothetical protein
MLIILASREGSLPGRAAAGSKVEGDDRMTLETGGWANISTFPSFFCFFSFLPDLLFFSIFSPLFLSGLCCSSPLWKGNGAVGHGLRIQLAIHGGDRVARARKNFQTLLQWRPRECPTSVLPLLLLLWEEGSGYYYCCTAILVLL